MNRLYALEKVEIGNCCFTKFLGICVNREKYLFGYFCLRYCERLKELKINVCCFEDFTVCEIDYLPSLEVIQFGEKDDSFNGFMRTSQLRLRSAGDEMK